MALHCNEQGRGLKLVRVCPTCIVDQNRKSRSNIGRNAETQPSNAIDAHPTIDPKHFIAHGTPLQYKATNNEGDSSRASWSGFVQHASSTKAESQASTSFETPKRNQGTRSMPHQLTTKSMALDMKQHCNTRQGTLKALRAE